ncbi:ABC transporter permease [Thermoleptolyngbya sp. C42_A2020_037]|jgi:simple sugar transport system permease protein|uniref:ABC transporter permease n=1 Tax=Thermoleptolyngbya oregonensis NK1-22 TaxID=2547457 RepID=A0AA96Y1U3_9CYAN|nr:ABC transporter permease [Thermoleptolyngbya sp. C42_A2020_037]MBF2086738.1 ABC transporter permease [Thermoleptolyngbya sp. C42_A2020_037]WOB41970.1 ABC transporter permease [Thermoleptolyngbya oregonensis NK1-22]
MALSQTWRRTLESLCLSFGAILAGILLFGIFCALVGTNPFAVYASIWKAAFGKWSTFQNTLVRAAPLMLSALCTALPARLGLVIIGNEGALVVGGLAAVSMGLAMGTAFPPLMVQIAMAIAGMVMGGIWIGAAGWLRHYRGVNETISSLLLNYVAIALLNHLVGGPMRDPSSLNKPSTFPLAEVNMLGNIPGTRVHWGLLYGLIACVIAYFLMQRTTFGFAARTAGGNIRAAKIAGLPVGRLTVMICFLAGSCAGLAGMVEVAAVQGSANESLNVGYGYGGILVAFAARHNPLAAVLISLLVGGILASGGILQRAHGLPDATVLIFQGLVFLMVLYSDSLYGKFGLFKEKPIVIEPPAPPPPSPGQEPVVTV